MTGPAGGGEPVAAAWKGLVHGCRCKLCMACRIAAVEAQADRDSLADPPLSQETADRIAAILVAERGQQHADLAVAAVLSELDGTTT